MSPAVPSPRAPEPSVSTGGAPAFDRVFRAHAREVARWAVLLGAHVPDVDDVVQEVFVTAHRKLRLDEIDEAALRVWLYRATAHLVKRRRRQDRIRRWLAGAPDEYARKVPTDAPSPHDAFEAEEQTHLVRAVLDRLPHRHRAVLVMFELEGMSGDEIAAFTGTRLGTVWVRLHRARAAFQQELERRRRGGRG